MKSTAEHLNPTRVKLTIEVPFDEFKPSLDKAYKKISSQVTVPGFRKGKVPPAIIDQRVGRAAVLDEALNSALQGWYTQAVADTKVQPLSQPDIDLSKFEDGSDIEVTAELDVRPTLEVPDVSAISVEVDTAEVTDDDITEQLDGLREQFGTLKDVERPVQDKDSVTIDLSAARKDGTAIEEAQATGMPYVVGRATMLDGLDEALIGLSAGESATFATTLVGGELKGEEVDVTVKVTDVKETELPELDDDFAATVSEQFDTIEELRSELVKGLTRNKRLEQADQAQSLVMEQLVEKIDAPLPDSIVEQEKTGRREQLEQQLAYSGQTFDAYLETQEKTAEEFDADLDRTSRESITAQFLLDQLVEEGDFALEDGELNAHIMQRAQQSGQNPQEFVQHILEHNHVPEMVSEIMRGKALTALIAGATITDKDGNAVDLSVLRGDGSLEGEDEDEATDGE